LWIAADDDADHDRGQHPADETLDRLVRRDRGHERVLAELGSDDVAEDVVRERAQGDADDGADRVLGQSEDEPGVSAENADVHEPEERHRHRDHRPGADHLDQVPEQREDDHQPDDQGEGALTLVIGDDHHGDGSHDAQERCRLRTLVAQRVEALEGGEADDHGDETRGNRSAEGEADQRDHQEHHAGHDPHEWAVGHRRHPAAGRGVVELVVEEQRIAAGAGHRSRKPRASAHRADPIRIVPPGGTAAASPASAAAAAAAATSGVARPIG